MTITETRTATLTVDAWTFKQALTKIKPAVCNRGVLPVLTGVRVDIDHHGARLTGTDLELTITVPIATTGIAEHGAMVIPHSTISDFVKKVTKTGTGPLTLTDQGGGNIVASLGRLTSTIRCLPIDEWPRLEFEADNLVSVDTRCLADVVDATSGDDVRPILACVYLYEDRAVGTDSYRLHINAGGFQFPDDAHLLVPARAVKLAVKAGGVAAVSWTERDALFAMDGITIRTRLVEGEFFNYRGLVPDSHPFRLRVRRSEMLEVINELKPFATDHTPLRFNMDADGSTVSAHVIVQDRADTSSVLAGAHVDGNPGEFKVAYNPEYLADIFGGAMADKDADADLWFVDAQKPAVLRENIDGIERIRLIMPVRVA